MAMLRIPLPVTWVSSLPTATVSGSYPMIFRCIPRLCDLPAPPTHLEAQSPKSYLHIVRDKSPVHCEAAGPEGSSGDTHRARQVADSRLYKGIGEGKTNQSFAAP